MYCTWFCTGVNIDEKTNRYVLQSRCGEIRTVSKNTDFFKKIYGDAEFKCPKCGKPTTVGCEME